MKEDSNFRSALETLMKNKGREYDLSKDNKHTLGKIKNKIIKIFYKDIVSKIIKIMKQVMLLSTS